MELKQGRGESSTALTINFVGEFLWVCAYPESIHHIVKLISQLNRPLKRNVDQLACDLPTNCDCVARALTSGNGRLLRIRDILTPASQPKAIEVLADKMESPVNLTVADRQIWVTESRIRHRLIPGREAAIPDRFFIRRFTLPSSKTTKTSWLRFDPP